MDSLACRIRALSLSLAGLLSLLGVYFMPFLGSTPRTSKTTPVLGLVCLSVPMERKMELLSLFCAENKTEPSTMKVTPQSTSTFI